jgi:hypothetical protein
MENIESRVYFMVDMGEEIGSGMYAVLPIAMLEGA